MSSSDKKELDLRVITMNIGHRLMLKAEQVVRRDKYQARFECLHEVVSPAGPNRLGFYRLVLYCIYGEEKNQSSHLFDIETMLDMRDTWEDYVERKVLTMMEDTFAGETPE